MSEKVYCSGVIVSGFTRGQRCRRSGKFDYEGKLYCAAHYGLIRGNNDGARIAESVEAIEKVCTFPKCQCGKTDQWCK